MTTFVTQCPHCRTSFRVSRAQLTSAKGAVRCGACLEVFNAARDLHSDEAPVSTLADPSVVSPANADPLDAPQVPAERPAEEETLWIHDDLDLDDLDLDEELAKLEHQEREMARELSRMEASKHDDDEAWAERLLREEGELDATSTSDPEPFSAPEAENQPIHAPLTPVASGQPLPLSPFLRAPDSSPRIEPDIRFTRSPDEDETDAPLVLGPRAERDSLNQNLREEPLFELEDEPLELDYQAPRNPWGRRLGWGLLNLIALLALAAQYVTYNFDELSRRDEYRPWLERICPSVGCQLPPKVDINQIRSSNLVVRGHPDFTGALVVDAIIYNRAPFAQPFPLLEVRFADLSGQTLASRMFKPGEYLSGELAGQREMPSQIPIHIALDILDPGAQAVNYSLSFHSPE